MTASRILSSQDPASLRVDPLPYVHRVTGDRVARAGYLTTFYSPRPEFVLHLPHPTNRALVEMRTQHRAEVISGLMDPDEFYREFASRLGADADYDDAERSHAMAIAERLAVLAEA